MFFAQVPAQPVAYISRQLQHVMYKNDTFPQGHPLEQPRDIPWDNPAQPRDIPWRPGTSPRTAQEQPLNIHNTKCTPDQPNMVYLI